MVELLGAARAGTAKREDMRRQLRYIMIIIQDVMSGSSRRSIDERGISYLIYYKHHDGKLDEPDDGVRHGPTCSSPTTVSLLGLTLVLSIGHDNPSWVRA